MGGIPETTMEKYAEVKPETKSEEVTVVTEDMIVPETPAPTNEVK